MKKSFRLKDPEIKLIVSGIFVYKLFSSCCAALSVDKLRRCNERNKHSFI